MASDIHEPRVPPLGDRPNAIGWRLAFEVRGDGVACPWAEDVGEINSAREVFVLSWLEDPDAGHTDGLALDGCDAGRRDFADGHSAQFSGATSGVVLDADHRPHDGPPGGWELPDGGDDVSQLDRRHRLRLASLGSALGEVTQPLQARDGGLGDDAFTFAPDESAFDTPDVFVDRLAGLSFGNEPSAELDEILAAEVVGEVFAVFGRESKPQVSVVAELVCV